jgi:hypothetical protein
VPDQVLDQDELDQLAIIDASLATLHHFFGKPAELFRPVQDPRQPYLITYPLETLMVFVYRVMQTRRDRGQPGLWS